MTVKGSGVNFDSYFRAVSIGEISNDRSPQINSKNNGGIRHVESSLRETAVANLAPEVQTVNNLFGPLYKFMESRERIERDPPLLAHYTSLEAFEKIIATSELWFSNPLFMNDLEEVRFAVSQGAGIFLNSEIIKDAAGSDQRYDLLRKAFQHFYQRLDTQGALDIYVFCLSEHPKNNTDGLLSMWRGYGGRGHGVALVFDTSRVQFVQTAPMFLLQVSYASAQDRLKRLMSSCNTGPES